MALTRIDSYLVDLDSLGGITFDDQAGTPTFKVDAVNHRVGIGTASPTEALDIVGNVNISLGSNYLVNGSQISTANVTENASYLYYTDTRSRNAISVTDSGGDGSLSYDSGTGVITYTGPSASETRAHFSAGTGVSIASGQISIGQPVGSSDNVSFTDGVFSGNVGIGTTNPQNTLDVIGGFNLAGKIIAGNESTNVNFLNVLDINATTGIAAYRPINFIDSSASIKLARVTDNLNNDSSLEFQTWDSTLTTNTSYWDVYGGYYGMGFRDRFTGRVNNRLFIGVDGNVLIGSANSGAELSSGEITANGVGNIFQVQGNSYLSGNVGIGTTNPQAILDIYGTIADLKLTDPDTGSHTRIKQDYGTTEIINSHDSGSTRFKMGSSATEVLRIKADGNVGIGTTNPTSKLHVVGNTLFQDDVVFDSATNNKFFYIGRGSSKSNEFTRFGRDDGRLHIYSKNDETSNFVRFDFENTDTESGGGVNANLNYIEIGGGVNGAVFNFNGIQIHEKSGFIGIGTTDPTATVQINGGSQDQLKLIASGVACKLLMEDSGTTTSGSHYLQSLGNDWRIVVNSGEAIRVDSARNVGIGVDNPETKLQINGVISAINTRIYEISDFENTSEFNKTILNRAFDLLTPNPPAQTTSQNNRYGSTWTHGYDDARRTIFAHDYDQDNLYFAKQTVSGDPAIVTQSWQKVITGNESGNVGIGTTDPQEKLHVEGNMRLNGSVIGGVLTAVVADDSYVDVTPSILGGHFVITPFSTYPTFAQPIGSGMMYYDIGNSRLLATAVDTELQRNGTAKLFSGGASTSTAATDFTDNAVTVTTPSGGTLRIFNRTGSARQFKLVFL